MRGGIASDKPCSRCKSPGRFYRASKRPGGLDQYCVDCRLRSARASRERTPEVTERYKAKQREWYFDWKVKTILGETNAANQI